MASGDESRTCARCMQHFTHKSSLVRHAKRCFRNEKPLPRRKACQQCATSKARCDLRRPQCGRCQMRSIPCEFATREDTAVLVPSTIDQVQQMSVPAQSPDRFDYLAVDNEWIYASTSSSDLSPASSAYYTGTLPSLSTTPEIDPQVLTDGLQCPPGMWFDRVVSEQRRQEILGPDQPTPNSEVLRAHTVHFILRTLKSWPRLISMHGTARLPPIIHRVQVASGIPVPLANCFTLAKCWAAGIDGSVEFMRESIIQETRRLLSEYHTYTPADLLATLQSLLFLLVMLLFGLGIPPELAHPMDAQLLVEVWDVKNRVAATGLFIDQDPTTPVPPWKEWALVSAKHRTLLALHHLDFVWSIFRGYPMLHCFELGPLPAPVAGYLWQAPDEQAWRRLYSRWRQHWKGSGFIMSELFRIQAGDALEPRAEKWLAEADEFGMMLMAEVNGY
ncbi:hypothetical protein BJY04DRAFT_213610 [Aspergillus karnatakaensis]|uniref:Zn(II)2Cys6 transcription factor domain-containing protein n=1 Tax=Aspergillus karnatakaensis TaxID=1810916 RepID=UPI003CCE3864